jgi:hypothetical protein
MQDKHVLLGGDRRVGVTSTPDPTVHIGLDGIRSPPDPAA